MTTESGIQRMSDPHSPESAHEEAKKDSGVLTEALASAATATDRAALNTNGASLNPVVNTEFFEGPSRETTAEQQRCNNRRNDGECSGAQPVGREIEPKPDDRPQVEFIYVVHTPEHVAEITKALSDADIVLIELVIRDQENREALEEITNIIMQPNPHPQIAAHIDSFLGRETNKYLAGILQALRASDKVIKYIDAVQDCPVMQKYYEQRDGLDDTLTQDMISYATPQQLRSDMAKLALLEGETMADRDQLVIKQIDEILDGLERKDEQPKIAVIQGACHTASYLHFARDQQIDTSRRFIGTEKLVTDHTTAYLPFNELMRDISISGHIEPDPKKCDRAVLYRYIAVWMEDAGGPEALLALRTLSDKEVEEALNTIRILGTVGPKHKLFKSSESVKAKKHEDVTDFLSTIVNT